MAEVTIAVPTYYGNKMLENCVQSILKHVANARILIYKNDIGWLQACNEVIRTTTTDIILLNDDTVVLSDIVKAMHDAAYASDNIGIVGGASLHPNGSTINNFGINVAVDCNTAHMHYGRDISEFDKVEPRKAVEGSCIYIKRAVIDRIGVFDENYGFGMREEVDYCFRAIEDGWKVVSTPEAKYVHFTSQTRGRLNITDDNFAYFKKKWGSKLLLGKV